MSDRDIPKKTLIVDASVLGAAGGINSGHPTGQQCRDVLIRIKSICHRAAIYPDLEVEWNKHATPFSQQWRTAMQNLRKLVLIKPVELTDVDTHIDAVTTDPGTKSAMCKDAHLISGALAADQSVVSLDDKIRNNFRLLAGPFEAIRPIVWVNPTHLEERAREWLEDGAAADASRQLGTSM